MIRYFVWCATGVVLLFTGIVLVSAGEPAFGLPCQEPTGKTAQQPDQSKQKKGAPKEEQERAPKTNVKAPVRVGDEEGDNAAARVAAGSADLTQEARRATNPVVRKLFEDLSPPHDLWTQKSGTMIKVKTAAFFIPEGKKPPENAKVEKLEPGKKNNDPISVAGFNTKSLQGFEQVVLARVDEFLKKDLDKKPTDDKAHLSRLEMLQEAEKAVVAGILYHLSAKARGMRDEVVWGDVAKELDQRLVDLQVQRLHILSDAKDWNKAFELASTLADAYVAKQSGSAEKRGIQREILNLLVKQSNDAVKDKKYKDARRHLLQLKEQFPADPELDPIRKALQQQANALIEEAKALASTDPQKAMAKLMSVPDIDPQAPGLRALTLELNQQSRILGVGVRSLPTHVSPARAVTEAERQSLELVFESLVKLAVRDPTGGQRYERYEADLSSDMPQIGSLARRFQLPRDVFWDDGVPLRANDVKHTISLMSKRGWTGHDVEWSKLMAKSPHIEEDPFQIQLTMLHGYLEPLALMDFKVLPELLGNIADEKFARHPVGSGPFHFVGREAQDDKCVFTANQYYWTRSGRERLPSIKEILMVKPEDVAGDFRDDRLSLLLDPTSAKFKELNAAPGIHEFADFKTLRNRRIYFLALNHRNTLLQNEVFRRELAHAIKREEILKDCFREDIQPVPHRALNGPYPAGSWACKPDIQAYNPEIAKAQLEKAKGNRPAKLNLTLKYPDEDPAVANACKLIKKQIEELDPSLTIELMARTPEQLHREVEVDHDYQLAYYSYDYPSDAFWLWPLFQIDGQRKNYLGYENDGDLEQLLRKLMGHRDFTVVQDLAHKIHQHIFDKVPFVPLWQLDTHLVIRKNLHLPPNLDPLAVFRDIDTWVVDKELVNR